MTISKNCNDALDRRSLFDETESTAALNLIDITFQKSDGTGDCTSTTCTITLSGKDYILRPELNIGETGKNHTQLRSVDDNAFGIFYVHTKDYYPNYTYRLFCTYVGINPDVSADRCRKVARSMGSTCSDSADSCYFN